MAVETKLLHKLETEWESFLERLQLFASSGMQVI